MVEAAVAVGAVSTAAERVADMEFAGGIAAAAGRGKFAGEVGVAAAGLEQGKQETFGPL